MLTQKKKLIEETDLIDVQFFKQLNSGTYLINFDERLKIKIEKNNELITINEQYNFGLVKSKVGYGERLFLKCMCGSIVKHVYLVKSNWACRNCHNLTYKLRNMTKTQIEFYKVNTRIDRLLNELDTTLDEGITVKPRSMHIKTYVKKLNEMQLLIDEYMRIQDAKREKVLKRIQRWWG